MIAATAIPLRADERSPVPLEKGAQWVYEAKVEWTPLASDKGSSGVRTKRFTWTAEVVACFAGTDIRAAVVHAWPDEAGGMDPVQPTGYSIVLETSNRLSRIAVRNKQQAIQVAQAIAKAPGQTPASTQTYLELPLTLHKRWGDENDDTRREDGWYCWHVESMKEKSISLKGKPPFPANVFTVAYRTGPSHELFEIVPGIGIVRYQFEHHGTVASAEVQLLEFKPIR